MTEPEKRLWHVLRNRQLAGTKLIRQSVGLVVEVDGDTHTDQTRDERRSEELRRKGFRVIRFTNSEVMTNLEGVCAVIAMALAATPHPALAPQGRGLEE